jgi:hypothetical protein
VQREIVGVVPAILFMLVHRQSLTSQDSFSVVAGVEPPRERYWIDTGNSSQFWRSSTIEAAPKRPKLAPKRDRQLRGQCHAKNHES